MVSVARILSTIDERRQDQIVYFGREVTGTKVTNPKLPWVRVSEKMLRLGIMILIIIIMSYDIQRYVSNDQAYDKLSGNKD
jgi:hypothetical protein